MSEGRRRGEERRIEERRKMGMEGEIEERGEGRSNEEGTGERGWVARNVKEREK